MVGAGLINKKKEVSPQLEGWTTYIYEYQAVMTQPESVYIVSVWNKDKAYGLSEWTLGQAKEVTGLKYRESDGAEQARGDIGRRTMKLDGDTLVIAKRDEHGVALADNPFVYKKIP